MESKLSIPTKLTLPTADTQVTLPNTTMLASQQQHTSERNEGLDRPGPTHLTLTATTTKPAQPKPAKSAIPTRPAKSKNQKVSSHIIPSPNEHPH